MANPYFTVAEARAIRVGEREVLADAVKYPDALITEARDEIEEAIEQVTDRTFVPRSKTVTLDGSGECTLMLPDLRVTAVTAVTVTDSAGVADIYDVTELADIQSSAIGVIRRKQLGTFLAGWRNVVVTYTYGDSVPPKPIKRAALILLRHRLIGSDINDRVTSLTDETGTLQFSVANRLHPFGIPEVDAILSRYSDNRAGIA